MLFLSVATYCLHIFMQPLPISKNVWFEEGGGEVNGAIKKWQKRWVDEQKIKNIEGTLSTYLWTAKGSVFATDVYFNKELIKVDVCFHLFVQFKVPTNSIVDFARKFSTFGCCDGIPERVEVNLIVERLSGFTRGSAHNSWRMSSTSFIRRCLPFINNDGDNDKQSDSTSSASADLFLHAPFSQTIKAVRSRNVDVQTTPKSLRLLEIGSAQC